MCGAQVNPVVHTCMIGEVGHFWADCSKPEINDKRAFVERYPGIGGVVPTCGSSWRWAPLAPAPNCTTLETGGWWRPNSRLHRGKPIGRLSSSRFSRDAKAASAGVAMSMQLSWTLAWPNRPSHCGNHKGHSSMTPKGEEMAGMPMRHSNPVRS